MVDDGRCCRRGAASLRRQLAILGFDKRGDLLQKRDQRRLELIECGRSLIARRQRVDRVSGARVERVLPIDPRRQPALHGADRPAGQPWGRRRRRVGNEPDGTETASRSSAASNAVSASL